MKKLIIIALSISYAGFAHAESHGAEMKETLKEYCAADARRLCPDVPVSDGALKACLKENRSELSPGCVEAVKKIRE